MNYARPDTCGEKTSLINSEMITNKTALLLGGGISGRSAARLLKSVNTRVILLDRNTAQDFPEAEAVFDDSQTIAALGKSGYHRDFIVKSPGISPRHPILEEARRSGVPVISEIDLAAIFFQGKIIGITGTDGKSTTTALTAHLISTDFPRSAFGGNIGVPFTEICRNNLDIAVLELSSYQLEDSRLRADIGVILNIAPDHLERHGSMESYIAAKKKLFSENPDMELVIRNDLQEKFNTTSEHKGKIRTFGPDGDAKIDYRNRIITTAANQYDARGFIPGGHNLENLAAAISAAELLGCRPENIRKNISTFTGLPHRFELVDTIHSTQIINDSKSTNTHSLVSWLGEWPADKRFVLILGGQNKENDISIVTSLLKEKECLVYLFGQAAGAWREQLESAVDCNLTVLETLEEVMKDIGARLRDYQPAAVIFSPACASFDQYKNFEERGNNFKKLAAAFKQE